MTLTPNGIAGSGAVGKREKSDFYPTPPCATEALMEREKFISNIWEPASGDGAASLSQLAMEGTTKPKNCKFPLYV